MADRPTIDAFEEGTRLRNLRMALDNPSAYGILDGIGALILAETQQAFVQQGLSGAQWKQRGETGMNPNWPAILADFAAGKANPPNRRFEDSPTLIDAGSLRKSFAHRIVRADTVEVGTMLPYADALHAGRETKSVTITKMIQDRLWDWIQRMTGARERAEAAPQRRENREAKQAQKGDRQLQQLQAALNLSKQAYKGQKAPKNEIARRKTLQAAIKARKADVDRSSRAASVSLTPKEAGRVATARKIETGAESLRWLLNPNFRNTQRTIKHPARPMVGLPRELVEKIERYFAVTVRRVA